MEFVLPSLLLLVGLVLIIKGGDWFVDAAVWIAEVSGIPKFLIGATIVSVATTLPELIVSLIAVFQGKYDMSVGNAVGSVTANVGLILAVGLLFMAGPVSRRQFAFKAVLMTVAIALLWLFCRNGSLGVLPSILILALFAVFVIENIHSAKSAMADDSDGRERIPTDKKTVLINLVKFAAGIAGIVIGANLLVDNGSELARLFGVPEGIIGVTIIAVGTSLPELVTTITAIVKKQSSLSMGNIVGANILDLTMILPLCSLVSGGQLAISAQSVTLDMPACLVMVLLAVVPTLLMKKTTRWQGTLMLLFYIAYMVLLCMTIL